MSVKNLLEVLQNLRDREETIIVLTESKVSVDFRWDHLYEETWDWLESEDWLVQYQGGHIVKVFDLHKVVAVMMAQTKDEREQLKKRIVS